jgi:outer membrane PBP1 activator LpoA protein
MATVMIRVDEQVRDTAARLSREQNTTIAEVVSAAIERARREHFWNRVHASYAALSPEELAADAAERALMDGSLADGLDEP